MHSFDANMVTILWEEKVNSIKFTVRLGVYIYIYIYKYV